MFVNAVCTGNGFMIYTEKSTNKYMFIPAGRTARYLSATALSAEKRRTGGAMSDCKALGAALV